MGIQFPFTAIVGQEGMRLALLLVAVDPGIGGVLIRGEKRIHSLIQLAIEAVNGMAQAHGQRWQNRR